MRALLESIEAAKSTDSKAIVTQLEKWKNTEGEFPFYFREWDHQLVRPAVIVGVKKQITDKWDYFDVLKNTSASADETEKGVRYQGGDRLQHAGAVSAACMRN